MDDYKLVPYEETPIEDKITDYSCTRYSKAACVWVERRVRINPPPESFSTYPAISDDRQLVDNPKNDLLY